MVGKLSSRFFNNVLFLLANQLSIVKMLSGFKMKMHLSRGYPELSEGVQEMAVEREGEQLFLSISWCKPHYQQTLGCIAGCSKGMFSGKLHVAFQINKANLLRRRLVLFTEHNSARLSREPKSSYAVPTT